MPVGTEYSRAVPHIWHKKFVELPLNGNMGVGIAEASQQGTQCPGSVWGLVFAPKAVRNYTSWNMPVPGDWDGTSSLVFRYQWCQRVAGDEKDAICIWTLHHWACQDWDNILGSKYVTQHATHTYGDEGTTNFCMHCGTFELDLTGGTYGTLSSGHTLFLDFGMPQGVSGAATALLFRASVEYMARFVGPSDTIPTTTNKEGG